MTVIPNPNSQTQVQQRQEIAKRRLRQLESEPVANWGLWGTTHQARATVTWWWMEMMAAAASIDDNLSNNTLWGHLQEDLSVSARTFYDNFGSNWPGFSSVATYYSYKTSDGQWTARGDMDMPTNAVWGRTGLANFLAS